MMKMTEAMVQSGRKASENSGGSVIEIYRAMRKAEMLGSPEYVESDDEMCRRIYFPDVVDGTGWAEAAFEDDDVRITVSIGCGCGQRHPSLEIWRQCPGASIPLPNKPWWEQQMAASPFYVHGY